MISDRLIPPVVAVFVGNADSVSRMVEFLPDYPKFKRYVAEELMQKIHADYNVTDDPTKVVLVGSSNGGLAATSIALDYPQVFGNVLSQSGYFAWYHGSYRDMGMGSVEEFKKLMLMEPEQRRTAEQEMQLAMMGDLMNATTEMRSKRVQNYHLNMGEFARQVARQKKHAVRFYLDVGRWEGDVMVLPNRHFRDILQAKGYSHTYREFVGGHSSLSWKATLPDGLLTLIGTPAGKKTLAERAKNWPH